MHNPMLDGEGRLWLTYRIRPSETLAFCREGSSHPSAMLTPVPFSNRQLAVTDLTTKETTSPSAYSFQIWST